MKRTHTHMLYEIPIYKQICYALNVIKCAISLENYLIIYIFPFFLNVTSRKYKPIKATTNIQKREDF